MDVPKGRYVKNLLIATDQWFNALIGNYCDETFSSRCWRWHRDGKRSWPMYLVDGLFFFKCHCLDSYVSEIERLQLPPEMRS